MNTLKLTTTLALAALLSACGATSNNGGNGTPTPTPTGGGTTIAEIQQGNVTVGSTVTLTGVIVTAIDAGTAGVDFWAQDVGGGPYSGAYFFDQGGNAPVDLAVGDEITVTGTYTEYQGQSTDSVTEIVPETITITNSGLTPTIDAIAAADIGTALSAGAAEQWEGCLIEIDGTVNVADLAIGFGEYLVSNGTDELRVDDQVFDSFAGRSAGEELTYLAGVWHYAFDNYKLLPRSANDVAGTPVVAVTKTVVEIQDEADAGHPAVNTFVNVQDALVVAVFTNGSNTKKNFYIQQGTGAHSGIYVFDAAGLLPNVAVGDTVTLDSVKYAEFKFNSWTDTVSELELTSDSTVTVTANGGTPTPTTVTYATLVGDLEAYEGVLVEISDATALTVDSLNPDSPSDYGEYTVTDSTSTLRVDDQLADSRTGKSLSQSLSQATGILNYFIDYKLVPRSATDVQ